MEDKKLTGYSSIDKPGRNFYKDDVEEEILEGTDKKMYEYIKEKNTGHEYDPAYSYFGETRSFAYLDSKIEDCAKALKRYGLRKGDCITLCLPNIPETVIYFYACNRIGVTPYLIDPRCSKQRVVDCMNISNSKLLVTVLDVIGKSVDPKIVPSDSIVVVSPATSLKDPAYKLGKEAKPVKGLYTIKEDLYNLKNLLTRNSKIVMQDDFTKHLGNFEKLVDSEYDPEIPAAIVNTSGTSGTPKGAKESNKGYNITVNQIYHVAPQLERGMTYFGYIPFFSLYGSAVGMHTALARGIVMDIVPKMSAEKFDKIFIDKKPNIVITVPRLAKMVSESEYVQDKNLSFSKLFVIGGDNMSPSNLDKINETMILGGSEYLPIYGYGSTESMMISTTINNHESHKKGGCGILYPGVTVRITDPETLEEKKYREEGEIYVSTPTMFSGYIGNTQETANSVFTEPTTGIKYYKTADKGYIDEKGVLYLTGRFKRLIKRPDGHQVSPIPIEDALNKCEEVEDCAIVGITNSYQDEKVPTAFVQLKNGEASTDVLKRVILKTKEFLPGEREMALAYVLVDRIPYTINGKIDFAKLSELKFEDLDFIALDDPVFDKYFTKGEDIEYFDICKKGITRRL